MREKKPSKIWPSSKQWKNWSLPSRWAVYSGCIGIVAIILMIIFEFAPWFVDDSNKRSYRVDIENNDRFKEPSQSEKIMDRPTVKALLTQKALATNMELCFGDYADLKKLAEAPEKDIFTECIFDFPLSKFPFLKAVSKLPHIQTVEVYPLKKDDPMNIAGHYRIRHSLLLNSSEDDIYNGLFKEIKVNNFNYEQYRNISYPLIRFYITARKRVIEKIAKKEDIWVFDRQSTKGNNFMLITKSFFIEVLNTYLKESIKTKKVIGYDDISSYFLEYSKIDKPLYFCLYFLNAKTDYLVLFDLLFTKEVKNKVQKSTHQFREQLGVIDSEEKLHDAVVFAINEIKHETDIRRLYQPFWDNLDSNPQPKRESYIQPVLTTFLRFILEDKLGVEVSPNVNEGVGEVDYKFSYSSNNQKYSVVAELKLADNKKLWHGLEKQLPAYMRAVKTKHGLFWILWHKTPNVYNLWSCPYKNGHGFMLNKT